MATTSSNRTTGKAITVQYSDGAGKDARFGLWAKVVAGAVALGCAAALALSGLRGGHTAQTQLPLAAAAPAFGAAPFTYHDDDARLYAPGIVGNVALLYREDHRAVAAPAFVSYQFTYHDDDARLNVPAAAPVFDLDEFTYREDHRTR